MLVLKAFGSLDVRDAAGISLAHLLVQSKRAALLAYLTVARPGKLHRRDSLLALFWPDLDQRHGRNALSQALSFLRRELGADVLVTRSAEEVGVDASCITSDVRAFTEALAEGEWTKALEAYGGDLLEGVHVWAAAPFTDWVDRERERLREAASEAAWKLAYERIASGELTEAEHAAQQALGLVPTNESAVRAFIQALAGAGDRAASLQFYARFCEILAAELEVEPAPETVAVMEAVRGRTEAVEVPGMAAATAAVGWTSREAPERRPPSAPSSAPERPGFQESVPTRSPARRLLPLSLFSTIAVALLLSVAGLHWWSDPGGGPGTLIGDGLVAPYDRIVVSDLFSPSDPPLGMAAGEWLRTALDQSDVIRPLEPAEIAASLRLMKRTPTVQVDGATAREIADHHGHAFVVTGEIERLGEDFVVMVRLESAGGEALGRYRAHSLADGSLGRMLDRIAEKIRRRTGESRRSIRRSPPLERVTTESLPALELYSEAIRVRDLEGRTADAKPLLELAIQLDTTFANAYRELSITLEDLGLDRRRRTELLERAYAHRDHLTDYERLLLEEEYSFHPKGHDACQVWEPLIPAHEDYQHDHPYDGRSYAAYGRYLVRLGRYEDGVTAYRRALALGHDEPSVRMDLFLAQRMAGDREGARATLAAWEGRHAGSPSLLEARALLAHDEGDLEREDSLLEVRQERFGPDPEALVGLARLAALRGRMRAAMEHAREARLAEHHVRGRGQVVSMDLELALVRLVARGDTASAVGEPSALGDKEFTEPDWITAGLLYAFAGDVPDARVALDTLNTLGATEWSVVGGRVLLGAAVEIASGRPERALAMIDRADNGCTLGSPYRGYFALVRGRAQERGNHPEAAARAYHRYLGGPRSLEVDAAFLFDTLERLGRIHETLGRPAEAATYYARAAELWKDADPELRPRAARLRARAAELTDRS